MHTPKPPTSIHRISHHSRTTRSLLGLCGCAALVSRIAAAEPTDPNELPPIAELAPASSSLDALPDSFPIWSLPRTAPTAVTIPNSSFPIRFSLTEGYYDRYMFRGLDVSYRTGFSSGHETPFVGGTAAMAIGDLALGIGNMDSLQSYVPRGAANDNGFGKRGAPLTYHSAPPVRYDEEDFFINYAFHLRPDLVFTPGFNIFRFGDGRFWQQPGGQRVNNTEEVAASLFYTGLPYVNQAFSYSYDFDAFKGHYLEYKLAAKPIEIYHSPTGPLKITATPNLAVSYDIHYNGTNSGWNSIQPGLDLSMHIADGLSLNVGAHYNRDLGSTSPAPIADGGHIATKFDARTDNRAWFDVAFRYDFPNGGWHVAALPAYAGKDKDASKAIVMPPEAAPGPWSVEAGVGGRTIQSSFTERAADLARFTKPLNQGDLLFATSARDANYINGSVFSASGTQFVGPAGLRDGTADFSFAQQSQLYSPGANSAQNRQITYDSVRYPSSDFSAPMHGSSTDEPVIYPYIDLKRELFRTDRFTLSVSIGYQFSRSQSDSGFQLAGIAKQSLYAFTYDVEEFFSTPGINPAAPFNNKNNSFTTPANSYSVVYSGALYQQSYNGASLAGIVGAFPGEALVIPPTDPQLNHLTGGRAVVAFSKSTLSNDLHTLPLAMELQHDLTSRVHARIAFGPTFNVFDSSVNTVTDYQVVNGIHESGNAVVAVHQSPSSSITGEAVNANSGFEGIFGANGNRQLPTGGPSSQNGSSLPGKNIGSTSRQTTATGVQAGLFGELGLTVDLDATRRWYLNVYSRYDYIPAFTVSSPGAGASLSPSSWGGGGGLGYRF